MKNFDENKSDVKKKNKKKIIIIVAASIVVIAALICVGIFVVKPKIELAAKYASIEELVNNKEYEKAIDEYTQIGDLAKVDETIAQYGDYLVECLRYEEAIALYEKANNLSKANETMILYGDYLVENQEYEEAIAVYKKAQATSKVNETLILYGDYFVENIYYEGAISLYEEAQATDKVNEARVLYGEYLVSLGKFDDAITQFEYVGDTARVNNIKSIKSKLLFDSGDYASAASLYKELGDTENANLSMFKFLETTTDEYVISLHGKEYYDELKKVNYPGIDELYAAKYQWRAVPYGVYSSSPNFKTFKNYTRVNGGGYAYYYFTLEGGLLEEDSSNLYDKINNPDSSESRPQLYYKINNPDGSESKYKKTNEWAGIYAYQPYDNLFYVCLDDIPKAAGDLKVSIYIKDNEEYTLIGEETVRMYEHKGIFGDSYYDNIK